MKQRQIEHVTLCRIRLAHRILIAATEQNKELLMDSSWQKAMTHTTALLAKAALRTPNRKLTVLSNIERAIGGPSDEQTLHDLEQAVNQ